VSLTNQVGEFSTMPDDDKFSTGSVARRGAGMLRAFQE
jgi:hypothetical protein